MGLAFSPKGDLLVTGGGDQSLAIWDVAADAPDLQQPVARLRGHRNEIWDVAWSADAERLVTSSKDGTVKVWPARPELKPEITIDAQPSSLLGLSSDGRTVRTLTPAGEVQFWNANDGTLERSFALSADANAVTLRKGELPLIAEPHLFFGTNTGKVEIWNLADGRPVRSVSLASGAVSPLRVSNDERFLVGWDWEKKCALLWDLVTGERLATVDDFVHLEKTSAGRPVFSPDGRTLAYNSRDFSVKLWDTKRRAERHALRGHSWHISEIAFAPDGRRVATASWDGTARVWDAATGELAVPPLAGHLAGVESVSFSPDSRTLLTASGEDVLRFWNVATGTEMLAVKEPIRPLPLFGQMMSSNGNVMTWQTAVTNTVRVLHLPSLPEIDAEIRGAKE
jgi:WD40 repeat protein